ncbi:MAG TPA: GntR family transcriptional regulator [Rhizomicrobium sp.]|jgi:GntR family transcriptional regulator|nr:GntR family transcriptional regulator [Rhizomicrobium sp.]
MTLLRFKLRPGQSIFEQVLFAAKKAFISGEYAPGQEFPSVRGLAAELKIHPNTAHKIIQHLIQERWLEVRPGIGTVVAKAPEARPGDRKRLLSQEVEQLVVEAKRVGLGLRDVVEAIGEQWTNLDKAREVARR